MGILGTAAAVLDNSTPAVSTFERANTQAVPTWCSHTDIREEMGTPNTLITRFS